MPHADSAALNPAIQSKPELWNHIYVQLEALLAGQRQWVPLSKPQIIPSR
jgi:L-methionine (R)-S-oxide reductase